MKLNVTDNWCLAAADREGDLEVGVGFAAADPVAAPAVEARTLVDRNKETTQFAFGRLIQLLRRRKSFTVEQLAQHARVDMEELLLIEKDFEYRAEPRTVHQLAQVFELKPKALMQLSGSSVPREEVFREAVKFAASSEPMEKLTREEALAVEHFVAALNRLADKDARKP
jgi:HTH-type transcriptional regulator, competence development regulator